jgi:hypothetical protein
MGKANKSLKAWVAFVKSVQKKYNLSYKDAIHKAKKLKDSGTDWMNKGLKSMKGGEGEEVEDVEEVEEEEMMGGDDMPETEGPEEKIDGGRRRRRRTRKNRRSRKSRSQSRSRSFKRTMSRRKAASRKASRSMGLVMGVA